MKILVTGSNGLLGQKLTDLLSDKPQIRLFATARGSSLLPITGYDFSVLDISDKEQVDNVVAKHKPDVIINAAAMTQVDHCETDHDACYKANVVGVQNVIDACAANNIHLVHVSTDFIFDGTKSMLVESDQPNPVNYYGKSKLDGELLIQQSDISSCIIRTVLVYGITSDLSRSNIVVWVKNSLEAGKTIKVVSDQHRTPTLAEDLASACFLAAEKRAQGIYHVSGKDFMSVYEIAVRSARFFNLDSSLISPVDSSTFIQPGRRPLITGFNIDKAKRELGFAPHSFEEGLALLASQMG
ncbi:MAG: dTDP-4-dehydrorhamnose reductase [Chryseolinea sp.]